jgi:formamidopyrimidine-DNA glycosylase
MPELPDLLHVQQKLGERLLGRVVTSSHVREPVVLRYSVHGNLSLLQGRSLDRISRHSHFLILQFAGLDLAVNPMLAGRFRFATPGELEERTLCFALGFGEELELRYLDEKKMGKAWLVASGDHGVITGLEKGGVDVLSPGFTRERFVSLLKHRKDQVRVFLMDKRALDSIGNAYADEILFEAGIHPKTWCRSLSHQDAMRLHGAVVKVMAEAVAEVARRDQPIDVKVRDFLKVRRKEVCPRCGSALRTAGVKGMDSWFCPRCQPATRELLVDWTKTPR